MARTKKTAHLSCVCQGLPLQRRRVEPASLVEQEEQPLPPSKEVEVVSSPSFSDWSSSDDNSERNLEDDKDAMTAGSFSTSGMVGGGGGGDARGTGGTASVLRH
jgi:hypothetical protein